MQRSFLKWPGGKQRSLNQLLSIFPKCSGSYYEPFLGGGSVCFNIKSDRKVLSDVESSLIDTYRKVQNSLSDVVRELDSFDNDESSYYVIRDQFNNRINNFSYSDAARFIYLNKCGFNGLYRVNGRGEFNVPFGKRSGDPHKDFDNLRICSRLLQFVELRSGSYVSCMADVDAGDFVYLDPPYMKKSETSFIAYNKDQFGTSDNKQLSEFCRDLDANGVLFAVSNNDIPLIREWYDGFHVHEVQAVRSISRAGSSRGRYSELLITNY